MILVPKKISIPGGWSGGPVPTTTVPGTNITVTDWHHPDLAGHPDNPLPNHGAIPTPTMPGMPGTPGMPNISAPPMPEAPTPVTPDFNQIDFSGVISQAAPAPAMPAADAMQGSPVGGKFGFMPIQGFQQKKR